MFISTNTGLAPTATTELAVATNVKDGSKISSPFLISAASSAAYNAAVPQFTATTCLTFRKFLNSNSKSLTIFPPSFAAEVSALSSKTLVISRFSSSLSQGLFIGIILSTRVNEGICCSKVVLVTRYILLTDKRNQFLYSKTHCYCPLGRCSILCLILITWLKARQMHF